MIWYILILFLALYFIFKLEGKEEKILIPEIIYFNKQKPKRMNDFEDAKIESMGFLKSISKKNWIIIGGILVFLFVIVPLTNKKSTKVEQKVEQQKVDTLQLVMDYHISGTFFDPVAYKGINKDSFLTSQNYRKKTESYIFIECDYENMKKDIESTVREEIIKLLK